MNCLVCDATLPAPAAGGRPRRYCSAACRQRAYHARQLAEQPLFLPENAINESAGCQPGEPLLAAIVFVPIADESWVYAVHAFGEFPWHRLVADLRQGPETISSHEGDVSSRAGEIIHGRDI
jgi:hypothetical protein